MQAYPWSIIPWDISDHIQLPNLSKSTAIGISVAIAGNIVISLALNCQKLAHRRLEREREARSRESELQPQTLGNDRRQEDGLGVAQSTEQDSPPANSTPAVAVLETEPLLNGGTPAGYGADSGALLERRPNWFRRLWSSDGSKRHLIHDVDSSHLASTHVLMPVDVVHATSSEGPRRSSKNAQKNSSDGNESDYLRSKLW